MEKMTAETVRVEVILSDYHGVYIPKKFGEMFTDGSSICNSKGEEDTDLTELVNSFAEREPDEDGYWDDWTRVLDNVCLLGQGEDDCFPDTWSLYQNGDLRAINMDDLSQLDEEEAEKFWDNLTC
jgi:hypothetical protein